LLGSLGDRYSAAVAINDSGQVVGDTTTTSGVTRAVIWNGTTPTALGSLGGTSSIAQAINNSGEVVGQSNLAGDAQSHGTIWNGTMAIDINTVLATDPSGIVVDSLTGINSSGQIVGEGQDSTGHYDAILLTPVASAVPEPSTWAMLILGFAGVGAMAYRQSAMKQTGAFASA
jgi:probable HAF family extracellular repeat protein